MSKPESVPLCERGGGTRWDPNGEYSCANRAKWRQKYPPHQVYCGRHIRYVGPVEPLSEESSQQG